MSRLLFAAARGARIKPPRTYTHSSIRMVDGKAECKLYQHSVDDENCYIHPDDAHLQYGPISTALREIALTGDYVDNTIPYFEFGIKREDNYWQSTADQRRVFCLILAECLADEGL